MKEKHKDYKMEENPAIAGTMDYDHMMKSDHHTMDEMMPTAYQPMGDNMMNLYPMAGNDMMNPCYPRMGNDMMSPYPMAGNEMMYPTYGMGGHYMNEQLVKVIHNCQATCEHMTTYLKKLSDCYSRAKQGMLLRDCADKCGLTANYIARDSMYARQAAAMCACICENCGQECARFPDQMSQNCARVCMHCARECRAFAGVY